MKTTILETVRGIASVGVDDILTSKRSIFLTDNVTVETSSDLIKQLMFLESQNHEEITLYINSGGGDVYSGLAVYDYIRSMKSPVTTIAVGTAASMGAILFLSGDRRLIHQHSRVMIHDPSYSQFNVGGKKPHEIQYEVDKLNETREILARIIAERTNKSIEEIYKVTADDTYYNAKEAVEFGLATKIIDSQKGDK